tara:strand:+ start:12253 stop:13053 length:801 start_codon:yes stop_codon:yes gene_type:complete
MDGSPFYGTYNTMRTKDFNKDFYMLLDLLKNSTPFAFQRFSDGELRILQNKTLILSSNHIQIGNQHLGGGYASHDHKEFIPEKHSFFRDRLMESFLFTKPNYYVGISCRCCVGNDDFKWQIDKLGGDHDHLTWSNLLINGNYLKFLGEVIPELKKKKIVFICNESATLDGVPFQIDKDFRVGYNCIINDYGLIETVKSWIEDNDINDHVFLFSASSLSNFMIHQLYDFRDTNTYIDIGTTLNPHMGLGSKRGYLSGAKTRGQICVW